MLTLSRSHSRRLLAATPPKAGDRTLPTDRTLAVAAIVDVPALIDAVSPWIDLCVRTAAAKDSEGEDSDARSSMVLDQATRSWTC